MKTIVKDYDNSKAFQKDAAKMAKRVYPRFATTLNRGHLGTNNKGLNVLVGLVTGGLGLLAARTPDRIIATYHCGGNCK